MKWGCVVFLFSLLLNNHSGAKSTVIIPVQKINPALYQQLPCEIRQTGEIVAANFGSFPPHVIFSQPNVMEGATYDFMKAIGEILGVTITHQNVGGFSALLTINSAGPYQMSIGPLGDIPERQEYNDFIDYVQEYVVFAVRKGNPQKIYSLDDTCGKRIVVMIDRSAEKVIRHQSAQCIREGKLAIDIKTFLDQPPSLIAVNTNQADAFFSSQAPLTYYVAQTNGELELAGIGQKNGFSDLYQGIIVAKGSPLGPIILQAYQELFNNGTYALIMKKWGLENNMLKAPGMNLAAKG